MWYKNEINWLKIAMVFMPIAAIIMGILGCSDVTAWIVITPSLLYVAYFVVKSFIYVYIINPDWKEIWKNIKSLF